MATRQGSALALSIVILSVSCKPDAPPPPPVDDSAPLPENTGHVTIHVKGMTKQLALT